MADEDRRSGARLRSTADRAGAIAEEARELKAQRRDVASGHAEPSLDRPSGTSVDWRIDEGDLRADRLRAEDDVRTAQRQERLATDEHEVASRLGANADALRAMASDLRSTRERIARTRTTAESLEAELRETREAVRRTQARVRATGTGRRSAQRDEKDR